MWNILCLNNVQDEKYLIFNKYCCFFDTKALHEFDGVTCIIGRLIIMENKQPRDSLIERRHMTSEQQDCWDKLTLAQKFSASSLAKYGYELAFVRSSSSGNVAILLRDGCCTTISNTGEIDTNPELYYRP